MLSKIGTFRNRIKAQMDGWINSENDIILYIPEEAFAGCASHSDYLSWLFVHLVMD